MANKRNNWQQLLEFANEDLRKRGYGLRITETEDGFYNCDILRIFTEDGKEVEVKQSTYAENYFEEELAELVDDAWHYTETLVQYDARLSSTRNNYEHYFACSWDNNRHGYRHYSRFFATEEEAVKKAREVYSNKPGAEDIHIYEAESWNTPDYVHHCEILRWNIDWWTGFLPFWEF